MEIEFIKDGVRRTARSEAEAADLRRQGFSPVIAIRDTDLAGNLRVRSATEAEQAAGAGAVGAVPLTGDVREELDRVRSVEERTRDARSTAEGIRSAASTALAGATLGLSTAAGIDSRAGLDAETQDILRQNTGGAEALGYLVPAVTPVGIEALIARGARFLGSGVARFAAEGAVGGAFNAMQEAQLARDPDVFAERLTSDMGLGALLGAGFGLPLSAASRLGRMSRGTSAARARRELADSLESIAPTRAGDLSPARMEEIAQTALNPESRGGRVLAAIGGVGRSNATGAEMQALERMIARHTNRGLQETAQASQSAADLVASLRQARGRLADVAEDSIPLQGIDNAAVSSTREELEALTSSLSRVPTQDNAVRNALEGISRGLRVADDATPQQALRSLYNAPRAISEATSGLNPRQMDELEAALSFQAVDGSSALLNGQGLAGLRESLDGLMSDPVWGDAGQFMAARRRVQQGADEALEPLLSKFESLGTGEVRDAGTMERVLRAAENSGDVGVLQRLEAAAAYADSLPGETALFPELGGIQGQRGFGERLSDQIQGSYAVATSRRLSRAEMGASAVQQGIRQGIGGLGLAAGAGAVSGGVAGAVGGLGVGALALVARSPMGMRRMVARIKNAFDGQTTRLTRAVDRTSQIATSRKRNPFRRLVPRPSTMAYIATRGSREEKRDTYEELTARINSLLEDPAAMASIMGDQVGGVGEMVPGLDMAMGMQSHRQLSALAAAMPLSARTQRDLARLSAPPMPPNQTEVNEFLQAAAVVEDPVFGVELMNAGRLTTGSARALAQAFPNFHEEVTARIISDIARQHHRGGRRPRLNYQASLMMSRFVGFPLDNTMTPEFNQIMSSPAAQTQEQDRAQSSRPVSVREPSFLRNESTVLTEIGN